MIDEKKKSVCDILSQIADDICDNYCKYRDTCDEDAMCDIIRDGGECPLDKLV